MKRNLCVLFVFLFSALLFAEGIPIGVMDLEPLGISNTQAQIASEILRVEFVKIPVFKVLERNNLVQILSEQELQLSGLTDAGEAVELGKMLNVKKILLGSLAKFEGKYVKYVLNIRMVDVETGSVEIAESMDVADDDDIRKACSQIAVKVSLNIKIVGEISYIEDDVVYTNLGKDVGVGEGDMLEAFSVKLVKDRKGRILLREENITSRLLVVTADAGASKCQITWKQAGLTEGMSIRRMTGKPEEERAEVSGISVRSIPEGAKAYLNGEFVGITPVVLAAVKPGKYKVEIRYPGHRSYAGRIHLTEGRQITVERELEKIIEVEDMMEGGLIPRKTTNPEEALVWSLLPGGGQFYNKYEVTGLGVSLSTFMGAAGTLLFAYSFIDESDNKEEGDYDEFYGHVLDYKITGNLLNLTIMSGFTLCYYIASILESAWEAPSPYKYSEYTEIKFGAAGLYTNSAQYPDTFTGVSGDFKNPVLDAKTKNMSGYAVGAFLSAGVRSRNFDTAYEVCFSSSISIIGITGRIKIPVFEFISLSAGCTYIINMNETQDVEYTKDDPVSFLRELTTPTIGISLETPSVLVILDGSPFAFGAADFFHTYAPEESWTRDLYLQAMLGMYIRCRIDYYFNARLGISLEARYMGFNGMIDNNAQNAGLPVFEHHNTVFITIAPVFRF